MIDVDIGPAIDRLDLLFIAASTELCPHVPDASCADCAVSIVGRGWNAVATIAASAGPTRPEPEPAPLVAPPHQ